MTKVIVEIEKILKSMDVDQVRLYIKLLACKIRRKARNGTTKKCLDLIVKDTEGLFVPEEILLKEMSRLDTDKRLAHAVDLLGWALWDVRLIDDYKNYVTYLINCAKKAEISESEQYQMLSSFNNEIDIEWGGGHMNEKMEKISKIESDLGYLLN